MKSPSPPDIGSRIDYHCIPNSYLPRDMYLEKLFQLPYPFGLASIIIFWSYLSVAITILCASKYLHGGCFLFVVPFSAYLTSGARRGGKHALQHARMTTESQENLSPVSNGTERLDLEAP